LSSKKTCTLKVESADREGHLYIKDGDLMDAEARGWDWMGVNLEDGGALMAFRMRDAAGNARWAAATLRSPDGFNA
jgi:predicted secreted hydrolase